MIKRKGEGVGNDKMVRCFIHVDKHKCADNLINHALIYFIGH